jgi:hypothetical protein
MNTRQQPPRVIYQEPIYEHVLIYEVALWHEHSGSEITVFAFEYRKVIGRDPIVPRRIDSVLLVF